MATVDFSGVKEMTQRLQGLEKSVNGFLQDFGEQVAHKVMTLAMERTPVDTGKLKASWSVGEVELSGNTLRVEIKNAAEHADFKEFGHHTRNGGWVDGKYMLTYSIDEVLQDLGLDFRLAINNWFDHGAGGFQSYWEDDWRQKSAEERRRIRGV